MRNLLSTVDRYIIFIRWLIPDSILRFRRESVFIFTAGMLGVICQALAFIMVLYYARAFSSGTTIDISSWSIDARDLAFLFLGSLIIISIFLISSFLIHYSRMSILHLSREYSEFCSRRVLKLVATGFPVTADGSGLNVAGISRVANSDSQLCSRVLRMILYMIIPFMNMCVTFLVLLYIDIQTTLYVLLILPFFFYFQFRASRAGAGYSLRNEILSPEVSAEYKKYLQNNMLPTSISTVNDEALMEHIFSRGAPGKYLDAYTGRLLVLENSKLISNILKAVVLGLVLLVMGDEIISDDSGWGNLVVYLLALNYTMAHLQTSFSTMTAINLFYPQVRRYFHFIDSIYIRKTNVIRQEYYTIDADKSSVRGSHDVITIRPGQTLALVNALELNRYTIASIARILSGRDDSFFEYSLSSFTLVLHGLELPETPLNKILGMSDVNELSDLKNWFNDSRLWAIAQNQLPDNLNDIVSAQNWNKINAAVRYTIFLIRAVNSGDGVIFLDQKGLALLPAHVWSHYQSLLNDRFIIIIFDEAGLDKVGEHGESTVIVSDGLQILASGMIDWYKQNKREIDLLVGNDVANQVPDSDNDTVDDLVL